MDNRKSVGTLEKRQATKSKKFAEMRAKMLANRKNPKAKVALTEDDNAVRDMADAFEDALAEYLGVCKKVFVTKLVKGAKWYSTLLRASKFAKELDVSAEVYIRGLFYIADMWGNRAPRVNELSDYNTKVTAKDRVSMYLQATGSGEATTSKVVGILRPYEQPPQLVRSRQSEKQLKMFMKNYGMSEVEVLKTFAMGDTEDLYFDRRWLLTLPAYLQLLEDQ